MTARPTTPVRLRRAIASAALAVAERARGDRVLPITHGPRVTEPRYGYGRPPHARLLEILRRGDEAYARNLEMLVGYRDDLAAIGRGGKPEDPPWLGSWLLGMDVVALYGFIRSRAPASYIEVGSGTSTMWVRRAIEDGGLQSSIVSIDPHPRAEIEAICDRSMREPLEAVDLSLFEELRAGDVVFMDGSHYALMNSDATVFFLEVLPELPSGVLVGVHDILLPDDYLPMWKDWHWSEQYLMAAYLLAEGERISLELACGYVTEYSGLAGTLDPVWATPHLAGVDRRGFGLWFTTAGR